MKMGIAGALVALAAGCSSGGPTTPVAAGVDAAVLTDASAVDAGPIDAAGFDDAAWLGAWTCTAGGTLGGASLPNSASQATVVALAPGRLQITATLQGAGNAPCSVVANLTSDTTAVYPDGQACTTSNPVTATLTTTDGSAASLQNGQLVTKQNVVVSNSPGFDGQTGSITSTCTRP